ncbi:hypothetical protein D3C78_1802780 [compost metagenome]
MQQDLRALQATTLDQRLRIRLELSQFLADFRQVLQGEVGHDPYRLQASPFQREDLQGPQLARLAGDLQPVAVHFA